MEKKLYDTIDNEFAVMHQTRHSNMFGKPCLKINGKAFCAFFKDQMVFKIGTEQIFKAIEKYQGAVNWDPSGNNRPMKDWLQVPFEYHEDWRVLAKKALEYVEK